MTADNINIALLIDGDNISASFLSDIMDEISKYGRVTIKKVYGDWTSKRMSKWEEQLTTFAIKPIQKFAYVKGKNATDIALIIDGMDILHRDNIDGFCIVSSDSDFTGLASRIRESGKFVMGIGADHTPISFSHACDKFIYTSSLGEVTEEQSKDVDVRFLHKVYDILSHKNNSEIHLSQFADAIQKINPSYDPRNFGFKTFLQLFESLKADFVVHRHDKNTIHITENLHIKSN